MLSLYIVNQSFKTKTEKTYLQRLQNLFDYFNTLPKWQDLKGTINLVLMNDEEIQKLNNAYRQKNKPTDVLSFPYLNSEEIKNNQDKLVILGEIFISKERAIDDAKALKLSLKDELNKLLVHGVLHVLGYDHIDDNDFLEMQKNEDFILKSFVEEDFVE